MSEHGKKRFRNEKDLQALKPTDRTYEARDAKQRGLVCRIAPTGVYTFVWYYRRDEDGKGTTKAIGRFGKGPGYLGLEDAREKLGGWKAAQRAASRGGPKLSEHPDFAEAVQAEAGAGTVDEAAERFLAHLERERDRPEDAKGYFERDIVGPNGKGEMGPLHGVLLKDVTLAHITAIRDRIYARQADKTRGRSAARHTVALLRQFFRWATREGLLPATHANPAALVEIKEPKPEQRSLAFDEIALVWQALDRLSPAMRDAARFLMLVPLRSQEIGQNTFDNVDFDRGLLTVPRDLQKIDTGAPWVTPVPPTALAILRDLKARADGLGSKYVLASDRVGPPKDGGERRKRGEPYTRTNLVAKIGGLFDGDDAVKLPGGPVSPHDLRRTVRTHVRNTLKISFDVAEKLLGHSVGDIAGRYDTGDLLDERREALEAWDRFVQAALAGDDEVTAKAKARPDVFGKVVPIRGRRPAKRAKAVRA
jgi:integrase